MKSKLSGTVVKAVVIVIILLVLAGVYLRYQRNSDSRPVEYDTVEVKRGAVERLITSSGTLDPVASVEVGTQVSGTVDKVLADFNDTVRAGQIIAEIDRSVLMSRLTEVQASLSRAEALFAQSEQEFKRGQQLFDKGLISEQDFVRLRTDYQSQRASLQVSRAAVNTASENVRYATIRSPIKGTVIARKVDVGQTVAASLNAPTLFIIAEDLKKMKIMAQVNETDIGRIRPNQDVRFSVQAYPGKSYRGVVNQVRLQPEVVQNVVTYSVVILADNDDGTLLPGMTASVEFVEAREDSAFVVPASALRFQPPEDVAARFEEERKARLAEMGEGKARGDGAGAPPDGMGGPPPMKEGALGVPGASGGQGGQRMRDGGGAGGQRGQRRQAGAQPGERGILWTLDGNNEFRPLYVRVVLSDGLQVAVSARGDDLREGLKVVTGEAKREKGAGGKQGKSPSPQAGGGKAEKRMQAPK